MQSARILMLILSLVTTPGICQEESEDSEKTTTSSPDSVAEASRDRWFIGTGVSILLDDFVDFKIPATGDSTLYIDMDSRYRPTIITGALFNFDQKERWNVLLSAKFAIGNQSFLMVFFLGLAIASTRAPCCP